MDKFRRYHVYEQNIFGDHTVVKTFDSKKRADAFVVAMALFAEDGESYYVVDTVDES